MWRLTKGWDVVLHFNLAERARSESGWLECSFVDEPDVVRFFARVFSTCAPPRVRADTDARMCKEGSSLSLTSLAGGAPLADLNCTRCGNGKRTGRSRVPLLPGLRERVKKKRKEKTRDTRRREREGECLGSRERVHRCGKIRPLTLERVKLPGSRESRVRKAFNYHARWMTGWFRSLVS